MSTERDLRKAAALYRDFREAKPARALKRRTIAVPKVSVQIGKVTAIEYRTTHGKKRVLYRHDFKTAARPELHVSPDGRQLLIVGGNYTFTERGIVDGRKRRR